MFADLLPSCPVCGALMADADLHQRFHDGLREIARHVEAPDVTPEQYGAAIAEQWAAEHP